MFIREHLSCNPYHAAENLLGISGFEIVAASDSIYNKTRLDASFNSLNEAINKTIREVQGEGD